MQGGLFVVDNVQYIQEPPQEHKDLNILGTVWKWLTKCFKTEDPALEKNCTPST